MGEDWGAAGEKLPVQGENCGHVLLKLVLFVLYTQRPIFLMLMAQSAPLTSSNTSEAKTNDSICI